MAWSHSAILAGFDGTPSPEKTAHHEFCLGWPGGLEARVIEKPLAHTSGSFVGIVGVYQRYEFVAEKRAAIEAWEKWLTGLTADAAANDDALRAVVP
jgi:hypothetical protein